MSAQRPHDHPMTSIALTLARRWCRGHEVGGQPALAHAVRVARTLHRYVPDAPPELFAAALVHDAPDFAPSDEDLDTTLDRYLSPDVTCIVRALEREHEALADGNHVPPTDPAVLVVGTADKLVSIRSVLDGAVVASEAATYWRRRGGFVLAIPSFRSFQCVAAALVPAAMATDLHHVLCRAEAAIGREST